MKLGNSTGLNQNMIYSKDLTKMSKEKAFVEIMINLTTDNRNMVDREDIVIELTKQLDMPQSEAYLLFEKMLGAGKLLTPKAGLYLLNL
jgi:N-acetylmuramic acid 6-phosphate (MurNAc-6-P) etherase